MAKNTPTQESRESLPAYTRKALAEVQAIADDYIVFPSPEARDAWCLWIMHAHAFDAFGTTPRFSITSNGYGAGKSRVLEVTELIAPNPINGVDMTPATLWRLLEHYKPTLLVDECDTVFGRVGSSAAHRELRSILNAGHRAGAVVPRTYGAEDIKMFHVFGPVMLAGVGKLPDSVRSRSVEVPMRKARPEELARLREFEWEDAVERCKAARDLLPAWAGGSESRTAAVKALRAVKPDVPVHDRDKDVWKPLLAIAELASVYDEGEAADADTWAMRAYRACVKLTGEREQKQEPAGKLVLRALVRVFERADKPVMSTDAIMKELRTMDSGAWDALTPRMLSNLVADYGLSPHTIRIGNATPRGYKREEVERIAQVYA
jgi:hypothetical protein